MYYLGDNLVSQIEKLREKLHWVMDQEDADTILEISQELDKLICDYIKQHNNI
jgi:hypothetical protein